MNIILEIFRNSRRILCICPCCGKLYRLNDLQLKYKGKTKKTWLDTYDSMINDIEIKEDEFTNKEEGLRQLARDRGRAQVDDMIRKSIDSDLAKLPYNPYDIKAILHPIDFIVFDGMNNDKVMDVALLCKNSDGYSLTRIQEGIENVIKNCKYDWKVARIKIGGEIEYK